MEEPTPLKQRIEAIKYQIDALTFPFFSHQNAKDFVYELDAAATSLDDALEIIERDIAYRKTKEQLLPV